MGAAWVPLAGIGIVMLVPIQLILLTEAAFYGSVSWYRKSRGDRYGSAFVICACFAALTAAQFAVGVDGALLLAGPAIYAALALHNGLAAYSILRDRPGGERHVERAQRWVDAGFAVGQSGCVVVALILSVALRPAPTALYLPIALVIVPIVLRAVAYRRVSRWARLKVQRRLHETLHLDAVPAALKSRRGWVRRFGNFYAKEVVELEDRRAFDDVLLAAYAGEMYLSSGLRSDGRSDLGGFRESLTRSGAPDWISLVYYDRQLAPVATLRLCLDHTARLPLEAEADVDLTAIRQTYRRIAEVRRFAIMPPWRGNGSLVAAMFRALGSHCLRHDIAVLVSVALRGTFPMYRKLGFQRLEDPVGFQPYRMTGILCGLNVARLLHERRPDSADRSYLELYEQVIDAYRRRIGRIRVDGRPVYEVEDLRGGS